MRHGTAWAYQCGCRCDRCRHAKRLDNRHYRDRERAAAEARKYRARLAAVPLADDDPRHGTIGGYNNHGCRCDRCRAAIAAYRRTTTPA